MNINKVIDSAIKYSRTGNLKKAEDICKKVLKKDPNNIEALHLYGVIFSRLGKHNSAMAYLRRALQIEPNYAEAYHTLGTVYQEKKDFDYAVQCFMKTVRLKPDMAKAWFHLGVALQEKGKPDEAITAYQQALYLNLRDTRIMNNLGLIFQKKRLFDKSIVYYRKALEIDPDCTEAYYNLGNALREMNKLDQAIAEYQKALQINPEYAEALNNLGLVFYKKGLFQDAESCYQKAVRINPNLFEVYNNLSNLMKDTGHKDRAVSYYHKAIELNPEYAGVYNNLGNLMKDTGHTYRAVGYYHKAIELNPEYAGAYNNLGTVLKDQGKIEEADKYYRKAFQIEPEASYYSNLLLLMNYSLLYDTQTVFREHLQFSKRFAEPLASVFLPHTNACLPARRLKIGYISPDFKGHSVAYFIEPVLAGHNRENVEVYCYSDVPNEDKVTQRMRGYADHWHSIVGMSDEQVSDLIRNDAIDILVDLAGHTAHNRMLVFARKPAPVQVSWIGYPATTGLSVMDYKIVDNYTDPPGMTEHLYTEKLIRMPGSFLCYLPEKESPEVGPLPALSSGHITFGSFNNFPKVTPEVIALWAEILQRIHDSRLILKARSFIDERIRTEVLNMFASYDIDSQRVDLLSFEASCQGHLGLYNNIDIGLDTFPYNGTTTTCEALWMGVPVITLAGDLHVSRIGASLLSNVGIPDLVATTPDDYIRISEQLAEDTKRLELLRKELRYMMKRSLLTDARRFILKLEEFYRRAWEEWCRKD